MILEFVAWYEHTYGKPLDLDHNDVQRCARSLDVDASDYSDLASRIDGKIIDLEVFVNNAAASAAPLLSMLRTPQALLADALGGDGALAGRPLFFLLDEFENLIPYQQRVINTLVKHSDARLSYKIGMKETGHRERTTLNLSEQLIDPADYALIDISRRLTGGDYEDFAARVCAGRLARTGDTLEPRELFAAMTDDEEALSLGGKAKIAEIRRALERLDATSSELKGFDDQPPTSALLVGFWAEGHPDRTELDVLRECLEQPEMWRGRLNNYGRALLFSVYPKVRGIAKYYAGWETYVQLSAGNIRYLLSLAREAVVAHIEDDYELTESISSERQTIAAQRVGERTLLQLQGLAVEGADLTRLVLAIGRIFGVMARNPHGHAPEVTQFRVTGLSSSGSASSLLDAGVMHLALLHFPGDKMAAVSGETKDFDYQLHPIFSPFFVYSHRRKRRFVLSARELLSLSKDARTTIRSILARNARSDDADTRYLPEQLTLFAEFYGDD